MKTLIASVLLVLVLLLPVGLSAQGGPPPLTKHLTVTLTNTNAFSDTTAYNIAIFYVDGTDTETLDSSTAVLYGTPETRGFELSADGSGFPKRVKIYKIVAAASLGASFVVAGGEPTYQLLGSFGYDAGTATEPYPIYPLSFNGVMPQPDGTKPLWVTSSTDLTGNLFREGIDKLAGALGGSGSSSGGGSSGGSTDDKLQTIIDNQNRDSLTKHYIDSPFDATPLLDSLTASAETQASAMVSVLGNAGISRGAGVSAVGIGGTADDLASFTVSGPFATSLSAGFTPLAFTGPFAAFASFSTKFLAYADVTREVLLWLTIFTFWFFSRDLLEKYMLSYQQTPQLTTKVETAQITIPGVGLTKQLLTTLTIYSVMLLAIGGTIALMNTNLANIVPALTTSGVTGLGSHLYDSVAAAAGSPLMGFFERFVPLAAMLECAIAQIVLSWSMPIVWASCLAIARAFHL